MAQRKYECKFGCGFSRSRKKVVTEHETHCTYEVVKELQKQLLALQLEVKEIKTALKTSKAKPTDELFNFNYVNHIDDLIEDNEYMQAFWDKVQRRNDTLPVFLKHFFPQAKTFYRVKNNKVLVKGVIGKVDRRKYGVDGATTTFTWYSFYDAFIPGICELIELFYGELLHHQNATDIPKRIKQDLQLSLFYKPKSDQFDTDKKFRDACRQHKAAKLQIIPLLQQLMGTTTLTL